jgi:hypothetical protein
LRKDEYFKNWGGISNMGLDLFKELVEKYGMIILDQKNIKTSDGNDNWNGVDIITIFQKTNKINKN